MEILIREARNVESMLSYIVGLEHGGIGAKTVVGLILSIHAKIISPMKLTSSNTLVVTIGLKLSRDCLHLKVGL